MKLNMEIGDLNEDSLDLTSLIDVIFLLLTFFILAATFTSPAMNVELAKAKNLSSTQTQTERLTFSIDADGILYHDQAIISEEELKIILSRYDSDIPLIFNVDQKAPFESFLLVLDEAKSQGKQKFLINGQPKINITQAETAKDAAAQDVLPQTDGGQRGLIPPVDGPEKP